MLNIVHRITAVCYTVPTDLMTDFNPLLNL